MAEALRTLVMGIGNPLMGDEGFGPRVVEYLLSRYSLPDDVSVVDAGTMGFTILNLFAEADRILVVDALQGTGHDPGTLVRLSPEDMAPNQIMHSLHDARLTDVLEAARLIGLEPEVTCIGVQVERITHWELELSPVVEAAIPAACDAVVELLRSWGVTLTECADGTGEQARIIAALRTKDSMPDGQRLPEG